MKYQHRGKVVREALKTRGYTEARRLPVVEIHPRTGLCLNPPPKVLLCDPLDPWTGSGPVASRTLRFSPVSVLVRVLSWLEVHP